MKRRCYITGRRLVLEGIVPLMTYQGEDIEVKVKRITENNEPIKDGAPITYTEKKDGARPAFKGLYGFPNAVCTSLNEVIIHGIPSDTVLKDGDILGLDIGTEGAGWVS